MTADDLIEQNIMKKLLEKKINRLVGNMNWYDVDKNHPNYFQIEKLYNEYVQYFC